MLFPGPKYLPFPCSVACRHIDAPGCESVDVAMTPIGIFELIFHFEQTITYEVSHFCGCVPE